jgi:hypothetical protein
MKFCLGIGARQGLFDRDADGSGSDGPPVVPVKVEAGASADPEPWPESVTAPRVAVVRWRGLLLGL